MSTKPCASCHVLTPVEELSKRCACGREVCEDCLIPMYDEDAAGAEDVSGWICRQCAGELVASGEVESASGAPWGTRL